MTDMKTNKITNKIQCIKERYSLTLNKIYTVIKKDTDYYYIINDFNEKNKYFISRFKDVTIKEAIKEERKEKLKKLNQWPIWKQINEEEKYKSNYLVEKFKVNTHFIITAKPTKWSSALNTKCPLWLEPNEYPYYGIIKNVKNVKDQYSQYDRFHIAMDDGTYGWSLETLIIENKIFTEKDYRKEKLQKIQNECKILESTHK